MEILNDCSDVDEIKFQEDGTWCPMRPKKESVKVSSQSVLKIEGKRATLLAVLSQDEPFLGVNYCIIEDIIFLIVESSGFGSDGDRGGECERQTNMLFAFHFSWDYYLFTLKLLCVSRQ